MQTPSPVSSIMRESTLQNPNFSSKNLGMGKYAWLKGGGHAKIMFFLKFIF